MSQQRFTVLDGLRGVAAVAVVLSHANLELRLPYLLPGAYLAVDFFFVLSGFVIAHAYESALEGRRLTGVAFLKLRAIRLGPLAYLGTLIGLAVVLLVPGAMGAGAKSSPQFPVIVTTSLLFLPNIVPGIVVMYPLNPPLWTLLYELIANVAYAIAAPRLSTKALALVLVVAAPPMVLATFGPHGANYAGFARVTYPFFAGVFLHRVWRAGKRAPAVHPMVLTAILVTAFFIPGGTPHLRSIVDVSCILVVFPLLVWIGASSIPRGFWKRACELSGEASYPLYVIHFPLVMLAALFLLRVPDHLAVFAFLVVMTTALAVLAIWLSRVFARPARAALQRAFSGTAPRPAAADLPSAV